MIFETPGDYLSSLADFKAFDENDEKSAYRII